MNDACNNPYHLGARAEWHSPKVECDLVRLKSGDVICENRCHTHPERSPRHLDTDSVISLFDAIVNGDARQGLPRISLQELTEVYDFYQNIKGDELAEVLRHRRVA